MTVEVSMQGELGIAVEDSSEQVHGGVSVHNGVVQSVFVTVVLSVVESVLLAVVRSEHVHSAPVVVIGESVVSGVFRCGRTPSGGPFGGPLGGPFSGPFGCFSARTFRSFGCSTRRFGPFSFLSRFCSSRIAVSVTGLHWIWVVDSVPSTSGYYLLTGTILHTIPVVISFHIFNLYEQNAHCIKKTLNL